MAVDAASPYFILASTSPRRRKFLAALGLPFTVVSPDSVADKGYVDETPIAGELPHVLVQRLSQIKAQTVLEKVPTIFTQLSLDNVFLIAADTVVALEGKILGKPTSDQEATTMLTHLRQQPHSVYSGLTVARFRPQRMVTRLHQSKVWMRPYTDMEISAYVASGEPLDKAGAYGIQDQSFKPVAKLEGCFASVMGLPLSELAVAFNELGLNLPDIEPICHRHTQNRCCQAHEHL